MQTIEIDTHSMNLQADLITPREFVEVGLETDYIPPEKIIIRE